MRQVRAMRLKQMNHQDLRIRRFHIKIQFPRFAWQSLNLAAGPHPTWYLSLELSHSSPCGRVGGRDAGTSTCIHSTQHLPAVQFTNLPRSPDPSPTLCSPGTLRPPIAKPMTPAKEPKIWFCSGTCELHLSSLRELKGELCPWIHPREPLELYKDSYSSVPDNSSHQEGRKRPNSSLYCVP